MANTRLDDDLKMDILLKDINELMLNMPVFDDIKYENALGQVCRNFHRASDYLKQVKERKLND